MGNRMVCRGVVLAFVVVAALLLPPAAALPALAGSLTYSTYLGGSATDYLTGLVVDSSGCAYVTGETSSTDFPTANPYQPTKRGTQYDDDIFVTKLSPSGSSLVYSTYLGGTGGESRSGIDVDSGGNAYLLGSTGSDDFPTVDPYQATCADCGSSIDLYVAKLSPSGSTLLYSTYLGGTGWERAGAIAVSPGGAAFVAGSTNATDFPVQGPYQSTYGGPTPSSFHDGDAFITRFGPSGSSLEYSTYLGGAGDEWVMDLAVDGSGNAYVVGGTISTNFPLANPYQGAIAGVDDVFLSKLSSTGASLSYSTYLGGAGRDGPLGVTLDQGGNAYVSGWTESTDFPTEGAYQSTFGGGSQDAFLSKFSASGSSLAYSSFLGGQGTDSGDSVAGDPQGGVYIAGWTASTNFPIKNPYQPTCASQPCTGNAFIAKILPSGSTLAYSTYLGGHGGDAVVQVFVDPISEVYVAGQTHSTDFPLRNPYQGTYAGGGSDGFVAKFPGRGIAFGSADYDSDHQDEIGVFRNGMWFLTDSPDYTGIDQTDAFGSPIPGRDVPDVGEFNCHTDPGGRPDGQTDLVVLRKPSSTWLVSLSPDLGSAPDPVIVFGTTSHKRISTRRLDTNGDGCSDIGVFRNGCFDVLESPDYVGVDLHACFGVGTDEPLAADLNGDRRSDLILWRRASSHYSYRLSPAYSADSSADLGGGDFPLVGDLNGDRIADLGSYAQAFSTFRFTYSPDFAGIDLVRVHGTSGDIPILADVNRDGTSDIGVFRNAAARWWFLCSPDWSSACVSLSFGVAGDLPIFPKPPGMP